MSERMSRPARPTAGSLEMRRICAMPALRPLEPEEVEEISRSELLAHAFESGYRLKEEQARGVLWWDLYGGLLAPISVGGGKTLLSIMLAQRAFLEGSRKIAIVTVPEVFDRLVTKDVKEARTHVPLTVPFHVLGKKPRQERAYLASSDKAGCYLLPYSLLSTEDAQDLLDWLKIEVWILDEAQNLSDERAARSDRFKKELQRRQPRVAAMSGTMTRKSLADYQMLARAALRENNPMPNAPGMAMEWSAIIDAGADPSETSAGPMKPLVDWARENFPEEDVPPNVDGYRAAYKLRLQSAPGVVASSGPGVKAGLLILNKPVAGHKEVDGWDDLIKITDLVKKEWKTPSGDNIDYEFHKWQYLMELSSGFYYWLKWPTVEQLVERRPDWSEQEAQDMLGMALAYNKALQSYHCKLRMFISTCRVPRMDTPMLVGRHSSLVRQQREELGLLWPEVYEAWCEKEDLKFHGMPERDQHGVRVCPFRVNAVADWAQEIYGSADAPHGGVIWYENKAMGEWLVDEFRERDIPHIWCPSESDRPGSNTDIEDTSINNTWRIASYKAQGTGKNVQFVSAMGFAQVSRSADRMQQTIGRLHRTGQDADRVLVRMWNTSDFDHQHMSAMLVDALYIHQSLGDPQKVIYGDYDPLPKVHTPAFLRAHGLSHRTLTRSDEQALYSRFNRTR